MAFRAFSTEIEPRFEVGYITNRPVSELRTLIAPLRTGFFGVTDVAVFI